MKLLRTPIAFEWDGGNSGKSFKKHKVTDEECEEIFFDSEKRIARDVLHSGTEDRYLLIGETRSKRLLLVVFTSRKNKVRVISARDLNKKERHLYEA